MISKIDEQENVFLIENSRFGINLYIRLKEDKHRMHKGTIDELNEMMFIELQQKENQFSYGLNHFIISNGKKFKEVVIIEYPNQSNDFNIYKVLVDDIVSNGKFYGTKGGFEKNIYISKDYLEKFKIDDKNKITLMQQYKKVK
jgi:hypothetical protein